MLDTVIQEDLLERTDLNITDNVVEMRDTTTLDRMRRAILVTSEPEDVSMADQHNRVVMADVSVSFDGFIAFASRGAFRAYGAPVNPTPVNGHYYRELVGQRRLLQFYGTDLITGRHNEFNAWNIVGGEGANPWPLPGDSTALENVEAYVEVHAPQLTDVHEFPGIAEDATPHPVVEDITPTGPTLGLARVEENGTVLLNPVPVPGEAYLQWDSRPHRGRSVLVGYANTETIFQRTGRVTRHDEEEEVAFREYMEAVRFDASGLNETTPIYGWAKLALVKPEPVADTDGLARVRTALAQIEETFSDVNDALNEEAEEQEWCGDYDLIVEGVGMRSRQDRQREFTINVDVEFTVDHSSPSGDEDSTLTRMFGVDNSPEFNNVSASGRLSLSFTRTARNGETASDSITYEDVYSQFGGVSRGSLSIDDWTVSDWDESD